MPKSLTVTPVECAVFHESEDLLAYLTSQLAGKVREGQVVAITSKIVSLAEGRVVPKGGRPKRELVEEEAGVYLGEGNHGVELTITHGLLIPSAGIDESNSESGGYILYPADPFASAAAIGGALRRHFGLTKLAVILTDSHSSPLRLGVTGLSLAHWGLRGTNSLVGAPDIFGKQLKFTSVNVVDSLAAMAVFVMGEAANRCPLALVENAEVEFTGRTDPAEIRVEPERDLYWPLLKDRFRK
jgi:dihydrofolate synthase / folylpolyglutamate synthase